MMEILKIVRRLPLDQETAQQLVAAQVALMEWYNPVDVPAGSKGFRASLDWLVGMKPRQIARKYGVSKNTVRSWHGRHRWADLRLRLAVAFYLRIYSSCEDERAKT